MTDVAIERVDTVLTRKGSGYGKAIRTIGKKGVAADAWAVGIVG